MEEKEKQFEMPKKRTTGEIVWSIIVWPLYFFIYLPCMWIHGHRQRRRELRHVAHQERRHLLALRQQRRIKKGV